MNKRQTEVEKAKLAAEAQELKHLKAIYNKAAEDIAKNISITDGKIEVMLQEWDSLSDDDKSVYRSKIYQKNFQKQLQSQINDVLKDLNSGQYSSIDEYLKKCYETGYVGTMYDIAGQGIPIITPIDQKKVITAMKTNSKISGGLYAKLGEDVDHLKKRIANNISRGIATSDSYENIARNIASASNVGMNNAMRIARTEGHRIHSNSAYDAQLAAKAAGADIVKQWDSTMDGKTRSTHRLLDGQIREVEEPFEMGGKKAMYPSGFGRPEEDINCRCALLQRATWALDDDELETLKERAAFYGLDKTDSFNDFRQKYLKVTTEPKKTAVNAPAPLKSVKGTVHGKNIKMSGAISEKDLLSFTAEQSEAIEWYVSGDGMWINQYLRGIGDFDKLTDTENELLKLLTSATNRDLPEDITKLYRSVDAGVIFNNIRVEEWDEFYQFVKYGSDTFGKGAYAERLSQKMQKILDGAKGKTITEKGFMSTTKEYDVVADWYGFTGSDMPVVLELEVPKGIKGADLKNFDIKGNEQFEVLLARNMKYEIGEISAKDGNIYIKAKLKADKTKSLTNSVKTLDNTGNGAIIKTKWDNDLKPRGQAPHVDEDDLYDFVAKELQVTEKVATEYVDAVMAYTDAGSDVYSEIRRYQRGEKLEFLEESVAKELANHIEEYIQKAPRWNGGETFRGVAMSDELVAELVAGKPVDMRGVASWSGTESIASEFAEHNLSYERPNMVIYHCETQSKGTGIKHMSIFEEEDEILCSEDSKYTINRVQKGDDQTIHVYLDEV